MPSPKTTKPRRRRRRSSMEDESESPSISVDISECEQQLEKEAHRRAEEQRKLLQQWRTTKHPEKKKKKKKKSKLTKQSTTQIEDDDTKDHIVTNHNDNESLTTADEHDQFDETVPPNILDLDDGDDSNSPQIIHRESTNEVISCNDSNDVPRSESGNESDSDFGLYNVSYDDLNEPEMGHDVDRGTETADSQSLSRSGSLYSGSESPNRNSRPKRSRKRKRTEIEYDEDEDFDSDLEPLASQSPPRKRRKTKKKKKEVDEEVEFDILNEIEVDSDDMNDMGTAKGLSSGIGLADLDALIQSADLVKVDQQYENALNELHAPVPSDHDESEQNAEPQSIDSAESDLERLSPQNTRDNDQKSMEEEVAEEETPPDDARKIMIKINKPNGVEKYWKIKLFLNQDFGSIIAPLEEKCGKKIVSLSFDGEQIRNEMTPQNLMDEYDLEAEDLIDAKYS